LTQRKRAHLRGHRAAAEGSRAARKTPVARAFRVRIFPMAAFAEEGGACLHGIAESGRRARGTYPLPREHGEIFRTAVEDRGPARDDQRGRAHQGALLAVELGANQARRCEKRGFVGWEASNTRPDHRFSVALYSTSQYARWATICSRRKRGRGWMVSVLHRGRGCDEDEGCGIR